jgi:N utilization substance protein A
MAIPGYDQPEKADKLINDAKALVAKYEAEGIPVPAAPIAQAAVKPTGDAKMQADERLRQELAALSKTEEQ